MKKGMKWGYSTVAALTLLFSQGAMPISHAFAADSSTVNQTTTAGTATSTDSTATVKPGILPDNFFYFVKTMMEKIDLAFTTNDTAKAKKLANYAAQKIAEANALIKEGKTDLATKTLQDAINEQNQATEITAKVVVGTPTLVSSDTNTSSNTTSTKQPTAVNTSATTTTSSTTNQGSALPTTTTSQNDDSQTTGDQQENTNGDDQSSSSTASTPSGSALETSNLVKENPKLAHNITALLNALQHIKNPKAQAALSKNIEKSFAKLGGKIDKLQKHDQKDQDEKGTDDQKLASVDTTQNTQATEDEDSNQQSDQESNTNTVSTKASTSTSTTTDTENKKPEPAPKAKVKPAHPVKKALELKDDAKKATKFAKKEKVVNAWSDDHEKGHSNNGHGNKGNEGHHGHHND